MHCTGGRRVGYCRFFSFRVGAISMTTQEILAKVASGDIKADEVAKLIEALRSNGAVRAISYKVSEKGALSVYGLGRFPVTLYVEQFERLDSDDERARRKAFILANAAKLNRKAA
jgi:hypothetical protein